jgi:hypothetical protein
VIRSLLSHTRHNAVAYLALFVALGGTSYAAIKLPANSVGAKQIKDGAVTSKQIKDGAVTSSKIKAGTITADNLAPGTLQAGGIGPAGPAGPKGDTGPAGPKGDRGSAGANATALWAVVSGNGTVARGSHVTSTTYVGGAYYEVSFDRDVSGCAFVAGRGGLDMETPQPGEVSASRSGNVNSVFVVTYNSAGAQASGPFHLAVFC